MLTLLESFWKRVDKSGPRYKNIGRCWLWKGTRNQQGRGQFIFNGSWYSAPRTAYKLLLGDLEDDEYVLHRCDNPSCVRPAHLFKGSQRTNMLDMISKGRRYDTSGDRNPNVAISYTQVLEIRRRHTPHCKINGTAAMAKEFGVTFGHIQKIVHGRVRTNN